MRSLIAAALAAADKPKPGKKNPGNKATDKAGEKATENATDTPADDGGLLQFLSGILWDHKWLIPVLFLAACIGINYLWKQYRNKQSMRGVAVRPLGPILSDLGKFARVEDKRPLHPKLPPAVTASRAYGVLTVLIILTVFPGIPGLPLGPLIPTLTLTLILGSRYSKIARARRTVLNQMFAVATSECRYPKGSELNPWNYVQITGWSNLTQPGQTVITIPAAYQSEDMKTREKFERNFNGTVSEENAWTYKWESAKNRLICEPAALLPGMAAYPGPGQKWDEIPVGVKGDGTQAIIPLSMTPHTLVCGPTGSGKSVLQRSVLFHILAHADTWRLVAIDMKKVEMAWLKKYPQVLKVATDLEEAVEVLRSLRAEMMRRYEEMEEAGVNHAKDLPNPPKAIFCMIDESTVLLAPEGIKTDEGKERDELHAEAGMIIGELGRLSRASMIHVMACFQRPDATFLRGETKANFDARIAAGRMDTTPSLMVLDSEAANRLPKIKGRGMIRIGGELETFQGYFAEQSWFDEWVAAQQGDAPDGADGSPDDASQPPSCADGVSDGGAVEGAVEGRGRRGLRGLAAKAAAKAAERAARMDAEATAEAGQDDAGGLVEPVVASDVPEVGPDLSSVLGPPPAFDNAEDPDGFDEDEIVEDAEGFDFDSLLVDENLDEFTDAVPEEALAAEPQPAQGRPVLPQPVVSPVALYQPGDPVPGAAAAPPLPPHVTPSPPAHLRPVAQPPTGGLPVQPPRGLPVRPPQPPAPQG